MCINLIERVEKHYVLSCRRFRFVLVNCLHVVVRALIDSVTYGGFLDVLFLKSRLFIVEVF